jgi:hypothetical protein
MIARRRSQILPVLVVLAPCAAVATCSGQPDSRSDPSLVTAARKDVARDPPPRIALSPSSPDKPALEVEWDPATGKGAVQHVRPSGDRIRTCFQCGYPKYAGGLVIGGYNGSGFEFRPRRPIRGHRRINVFCAQDESIWDRDENREYTYGWSENFGKGDDGETLAYMKGRMLEGGPERVVLESINRGGCYRVTKVAYTRADADWWIIATRIANTCDHAIRFDFFSGDDPWLGLYRTSDGDVGWTPEGLVRNERALDLGRFSAGGIYDLGNGALGQKEGSFTNQADFFEIDPAVPLPDKTFFANSFAHREADIDPDRPLDNKTLTAINLGWIDRRLAPGEAFTVAFALGLASTSAPGRVPAVPAVTDADWSAWRRYLREPHAPRRLRAEFASELVQLDITARQMTVTGTYCVYNPTGASAAIGITYPIITAPGRPAPKTIEADGTPRPVAIRSDTLAEAHFPVRIPAHGIRRFEVRYTQPHTPGRAVYMVTSANHWPSPLTRALFVIRRPETFKDVEIAYPVRHTAERDGVVEHLVALQPFSPEKEMTVTWR